MRAISSGSRREKPLINPGLNVACCEGFRMPAAHGGWANTGGRRPKASKERNRGKGYGWLARAMEI